MKKIYQERQRMNDYQKNIAASAVQRVWKTHVEVLANAARLEMERRELIKAVEEGAVIEEALRQKQVYHDGVSDYYVNLKVASEAEAARKLIDDKEKVKISQLVRRREWENWRKNKKEQQEDLVRKEQEDLKTWNTVWEDSVEVRVAERKVTSTRILKEPDGQEERRTKVVLLGFIQARKKVKLFEIIIEIYIEIMKCIRSFLKDTKNLELK